MASIKRTVRGDRTYFAVHHTYRWQGRTWQVRRYLGTTIPRDPQSLLLEVERGAWQKSWFSLFDQIRARWQERLRRLPPEVAREEAHDFIVEFTFDTNRIEGSTLSLDETEAVVDRGISPSSRPLSDVLEAREHARLADRLFHDPPRLDLQELLNWHDSLFRATKPRIAGKLRDYEVGIRGSRYQPPPGLEVRPLLIELLRRTSRAEGKLHPVELAASFHQRFEAIHPFGDGNGRVGRLAMNVLLAREGLPPLNVPYATRRGYYRALERSSDTEDVRPFIGWFFRRYRAAYRHLLAPRRLVGGRKTRK